MSLSLLSVQGHLIVEGTPGQRLLQQVGDVNRLLEACFEHGSQALLLYSENLTPQFFDLRSGEAGEILQKLRNYRIRVAVVREPTLVLNLRFSELMIDEGEGADFRLFGQRREALDWLADTDSRDR